MRINVVLPSRGLIFAEAMQALLDNLQGYEYKIFTSHNLIIPDCQNKLTEKALFGYPDYILYVEEDTVMPEGALDDMVMAKADIACVDYGVAGYSCITRDKTTHEALWCGLGCTLVKREVFDKLDKPYFRSDKALLINAWPEIKWIDTGEQNYGGQDIWFGMHARKKGFKIQKVAGECKHLKLDFIGRKEVNKGLHLISQKEKISKYQTL